MSSLHLRSFCWGVLSSALLFLLALGAGRQNATERDIHSSVIPQKVVVETRVVADDDGAKRLGSFTSNDQPKESARGDYILPVKAYEISDVSSSPMDPFELDYADVSVRHIGVFIDPEESTAPY